MPRAGFTRFLTAVHRPDRYAAQRRLVLSATMLACHGRVQREGEMVHVITDRLENLSDLLRSVGGQDKAGKEGHEARSIPVPELRDGVGIKVPTREFR